jgi:N-acetyl-D-muramate 6-phosphate phosphatase
MALDLSRVRALCFDVDGTLCDTDDQWVQNFERWLNPLRPLFPKKDLRPFARWSVMSLESPGNLVYHLLDRVGLDDEVAGLVNFIAHHIRGHRPHHFLIVPQVQEMLQGLKVQYPMAVVSARDERTTRAFLEYFDLLPLFDIVITAQTCHYTKPFPDPVILAAKTMSVHPSECLMIGDTTADIRAGKAAGAQTVGVLCGFGQEKELIRAGADLVLHGTGELLSLLQKVDDQPASMNAGIL